MSRTLLSTKLTAPRPRQALVPRSRLLTLMAKASAFPLTLVVAPPGYGKTTLVSSWLRETSLPFTWLSLDDEDNDPIRFLDYILTALHKVLPSITPELLDLVQGSQSASFEPLEAHLINESANAGDFILVLDDFHVLQSQPVLELLTRILEHIPPPLHIVLISRTDPPLPLARMRARGQLLEIRSEALRFSEDEIALFYGNLLGLEVSRPDISAIEARTEGWAAGLQLAGLAMQSLSGQAGRDTHNFISDFTGSHTYIMDYLTEEVLRQQPEPVRSFLLQTAVLERMCAPLCDAVVEPTPAGTLDSQAMLEAIEQKHLFVIPMDEERRWYRYHHIFKEVLNRRLVTLLPGQIPGLHARASVWHEENHSIHEAIQHAVKSGDQARTARLVERHGCELLMKGEVVNLSGWLSAIDPFISTRPWLAMQKAWAQLLTGQLESAAGWIETGENLLSSLEPTQHVRTMQGSFAAARAHLANLQGETGLAAQFARQALNFLPDSGDFSCSLRSVATSLLGDAAWMQGDMGQARLAYAEAVRIGQGSGSPHTVLMTNGPLADVLIEQGQLHQAARVFNESMRLTEEVDGPNSFYAQFIYYGLSRVYYAWNDLDKAADAIEQCERLARRWGNIGLQSACLALTVQVQRARGSVGGMHEALAAAEKFLEDHPLAPRWSMLTESVAARIGLDEGKTEKAFLFVRDAGISLDFLARESHSLRAGGVDEPVSYKLEPVYPVMVRLALMQGNAETALALCERLLSEAQAGERAKSMTELYILQALAFQAKKDTPGALAALESAIGLAQPEHSSRVFLDEGEKLGKLLYQMKAHGQGGEFVDGLLFCLDLANTGEKDTAHSDQGLLVEPLSERELEVLKCIASGLTNQEIAAQFVISPKTVKRHISNIYAKLDAKNRTQAVSLARALRLIV